MRQLLAEASGTFALVFFGTGSIIIDEQTHIVGNVGIALTFGVIIMIMIYVFAGISGAHFNPAVTIGFVGASLFKTKKIIGYIFAQLIGAFIASALLRLLFPHNTSLGSTFPFVGHWQTFVIEFILTFLLMSCIIYSSQGSKLLKPYAALIIGGVIFLEALLAGPFTGASMNPARSFSSALVSGSTSGLWIYLVAPIMGAFTASLLCKKFMRTS
jgi:aquaporin NIP